MEEPKKILLINDLAGYGKVALSAIIPILFHMNFRFIICPLRSYPIRWIMESLRFWIRQNI